MRQNDLNVTSLKRGEFKLSIGELSNGIPYTVQKLSNKRGPVNLYEL